MAGLGQLLLLLSTAAFCHAQLGCYSVPIPASNICPGGVASYCTTSQAAANTLAAATISAYNLITVASTDAFATAACALVGGTPNQFAPPLAAWNGDGSYTGPLISWWSQPSIACPPLPICSASCGFTGTTAPTTTAAATTATPQVPCCSFLINQINTACGGINQSNLTATIVAGASLTGLSSLISVFAPGATTCAISSCYGSSYSCQSATVSVSSLSMCSGGTASYCMLSSSMAAAQAALDSVSISAVTTAGEMAAGTAFCSFLGGTPTSWWSNPSLACPALSTCSASTCSASSGPIAPLPPCCSGLRAQISTMCSGMTISPFSYIQSYTNIPPALAGALGATMCADTNCVGSGAGEQVSHSVALVIILLISVLGWLMN